MNLVEHYRVMARYNQWMNHKLYAICADLDDEERKRSLGAFFDSIHQTLNHILIADRRWMLRFTGDRARFVSHGSDGQEIPVTSLGQILYEEFAELEAQRTQTDEHIVEWASSLQPGQLEAMLTYDDRYKHPLWWAASHFFNHQTHHRGQVTTLLTQLGHDVGVTDLVVMLRNQAA
jgi:uncharacterized damage-inducible protein DinB